MRVDIRNASVVEMRTGTALVASATGSSAPLDALAEAPGGEGGTRETVCRLLMESGPMTAAQLAQRLGISAVAVRRHLDALIERGHVGEADPRRSTRRGRGRPARAYAITDAGRASFPHAYDELATAALRFLGESGGAQALEAFACFRTGELERSLRTRMAADPAADASGAPAGEADPTVLAAALSAQGYAASVQRTASGVQLCQHNCPIAHAAAQFGQLCEAETRMFERLLGTHVQRLATLAHGDGVCTTFIPDPRPPAPVHVAGPAPSATEPPQSPDRPASERAIASAVSSRHGGTS